MPIPAQLGSQIEHDGDLHLVVRIVESSTFFEAGGECYILEEKYAELRRLNTNEIGFKMFSQIKHPFQKVVEQKGLDPKIWRKV